MLCTTHLAICPHSTSPLIVHQGSLHTLHVSRHAYTNSGSNMYPSHAANNTHSKLDSCALVAELILSPVAASVTDCQDVSCGVEFTMWLCDGKVFSAGLPQHGQLGHNTDHEYNAKDCKSQLEWNTSSCMPRLTRPLTAWCHHERRCVNKLLNELSGTHLEYTERVKHAAPCQQQPIHCPLASCCFHAQHSTGL